MQRTRSHDLFIRAQHRLPGGVNSPVRAYTAVGGEPVFIARGQGAYLFDADGHRYVDWVSSWGPLILGHAPPRVVEAICRAAQQGTSFGASTEREVELAERICQFVKSIQKIRFVNSGTEATMSAVRLARGVTGRVKIIKFAGCYHGHADAFLADMAGSGLATLGIPSSAGVPPATAADTLTVTYNDVDALEALMAQFGDQTAAIMVEPIACNMGLVLPEDGFLPSLRRICNRYGALLIFDEVITGLRLGLGGAQERYHVVPDLTVLGKIIGGGLPVGAYGGRADIMDQVAPQGPVYQAGTLSGNPLAMAAGLATLEELCQPGFYENLEKTSAALVEGMQEILSRYCYPAHPTRVGSIFHLWFQQGASCGPRHHADVQTTDTQRFSPFFHAMLQAGVAWPPSAFEVGFVSAAHASAPIHHTLQALEDTCKAFAP